jgi:hypothetical protein
LHETLKIMFVRFIQRKVAIRIYLLFILITSQNVLLILLSFVFKLLFNKMYTFTVHKLSTQYITVCRNPWCTIHTIHIKVKVDRILNHSLFFPSETLINRQLVKMRNLQILFWFCFFFIKSGFSLTARTIHFLKFLDTNFGP